jgi:hypothetical protein
MRALTDAELDEVAGGAPSGTMNNAPSLVSLTASPSSQTTQIITLSNPGELINLFKGNPPGNHLIDITNRGPRTP